MTNSSPTKKAHSPRIYNILTWISLVVQTRKLRNKEMNPHWARQLLKTRHHELSNSTKHSEAVGKAMLNSAPPSLQPSFTAWIPDRRAVVVVVVIVVGGTSCNIEQR